MELELIYPEFDDSIIIDGDNISFKNSPSKITVLENLGNRAYKVLLSGFVCILVHDDEFCAINNMQVYDQFYDEHSCPLVRIPKYKTLFSIVAKNACSTLEAHFFNYYHRFFWEKKIKEGELVWLRDKFQKRRKKIHLELDEYFRTKEKWEHIYAVYDDPVRRCVRTMNYKYMGANAILRNLRPPYDENISDYISKFILLTRLHMFNVDKFDQHLAPISTTHRYILDDVTTFVYLYDLDRFLLEKFNIKPERFNVSPERVITTDLLSEKQLADIKEIYKKDFEIPIKYADKFYKVK